MKPGTRHTQKPLLFHMIDRFAELGNDTLDNRSWMSRYRLVLTVFRLVSLHAVLSASLPYFGGREDRLE